MCRHCWTDVIKPVKYKIKKVWKHTNRARLLTTNTFFNTSPVENTEYEKLKKND